MTGTYAAAVQRILIGRLVATAAAGVALIGTFLPWVRSGTRNRRSYEIFSLVDRLGFSPTGVVGWAVRLWPVAPLLLAAAVTALWFPRRWVTPAAVIVGVAYVGVVSAAVRSASSSASSALLTICAGPTVTLVGAVSIALGALLTHSAPAPLSNRQ